LACPARGRRQRLEPPRGGTASKHPNERWQFLGSTAVTCDGAGTTGTASHSRGRFFRATARSELVVAPGSDTVLNATPERSGGKARDILGLACGRGSAGRASPCQGEGRGFESRRPLGDALAVNPAWRSMASSPGSQGAPERPRTPARRQNRRLRSSLLTAEWPSGLGKGLQSPVHGFDSRLRLSNFLTSGNIPSGFARDVRQSSAAATMMDTSSPR
jgi:hypothetical protein